MSGLESHQHLYVLSNAVFLHSGIVRRNTDGETKSHLDLTKTLRQRRNRFCRIFVRDKFRCRRCGIYGVELTVDHIVPLSKGGHPTDPSNLQTLCDTCNNIKADSL